jgi:hypothetical protein
VFRPNLDPPRFRNVRCDGGAERRVTLGGTVVRPTLIESALTRFDNVGRRRKIRLADLEMYDAAALRLKRPRSYKHIKGALYTEPADSFCQQGHGIQWVPGRWLKTGDRHQFRWRRLMIVGSDLRRNWVADPVFSIL